MATIQDKTKALISSKLKVAESEITEDKSLFNDLGADSLDFVELCVTLEQEFNIKLNEEDTKKVQTVGDVYALVKKNLKNK